MQEINVLSLFSALNKEVQNARNGKVTKPVKLSDHAMKQEKKD